MEFLLPPLSRSAGPNDKLDTDRALRPAIAAAADAPFAEAVPWTPAGFDVALPPRAGDWSLNVLAVMDPELRTLRSPPFLPSGSVFPGGTLIDEADCFLRSIRLVWTSLTGVGGGVWLRRAAAAAEEDRLGFGFWDARNAWRAAVCAEGDGLVFRGYSSVSSHSISSSYSALMLEGGVGR
ncbi:uncharacterized protein ARB_06935 [Trichophyton benhamiae CBS 112371]|uniref:Uncharacterized protein n=1 Tax=Arthroderma benhamiae (strain ATCC MYA-4681 / CBS 112371) TaxID=663331 RepID=D4ARS1_ARTBC|nr:uncharacterized protein ARB_06935 [Trichophyton benhamiae CBS 112371]EFE33985.1 hypothetical protein ARB_06935 [Trichophyton benhamiae CBS 112371]